MPDRKMLDGRTLDERTPIKETLDEGMMVDTDLD